MIISKVGKRMKKTRLTEQKAGLAHTYEEQAGGQ